VSGGRDENPTKGSIKIILITGNFVVIHYKHFLHCFPDLQLYAGYFLISLTASRSSMRTFPDG